MFFWGRGPTSAPLQLGLGRETSDWPLATNYGLHFREETAKIVIGFPVLDGTGMSHQSQNISIQVIGFPIILD